MARAQSPGYPNASLPKAIQSIRQIFDADRRNPIDREVAAKHIGYSGSSGAADKAIATLAHFGLTEKVGKGEVRVSQLAVDIIHPDKPEDRKKSLFQAAFSPQIFKDIYDRFGAHVSEGALESYLKRENFLDRAIGPVTKAYLETCRFLEQEKAFEGGDGAASKAEDLAQVKGSEAQNITFGGARLGDLVQWESQGVLQFDKPARVRFISDDGLWVGVEGSDTGVPMSEVIVEERAAAAAPRFVIPDEKPREVPAEPGEVEWMRNRLGGETKVRLMVSGEMGPKQIGKLIKLLKAQQAVLADDDEDDDD
ncbi:hypothetical protein [Caulobacter sp. X]|uniref:hypothetical protein n=1 Tax=Caulobacter sp. X TaxID=2048901 RepID=UPI0011785B5E|nr:hypothetical protein [Caulobacter sp. X]